MHRLLIAAASAAVLAASVAPALADDYPPCTTHDQDHCLVTPMHGHHHPMGKHHHFHLRPKHK